MTQQQPHALKGGKAIDPTRSTDMRDAHDTAHTNPRTRHHARVPILGRTGPPPPPDSVDWHLPAYGSKNFFRYLLHAGVSLREFQQRDLYQRAIGAGLIVANRWKGPANFKGDVTLPPIGTAPKFAHRRGPEETHIAPKDR